jgi:hypothetical protein
LYKTPRDAAAFGEHYFDRHLPHAMYLFESREV